MLWVILYNVGDTHHVSRFPDFVNIQRCLRDFAFYYKNILNESCSIATCWLLVHFILIVYYYVNTIIFSSFYIPPLYLIRFYYNIAVWPLYTLISNIDHSYCLFLTCRFYLQTIWYEKLIYVYLDTWLIFAFLVSVMVQSYYYSTN